MIRLSFALSLLYLVAIADNIKQKSPFDYNDLNTSSITQRELENVYLNNFNSGITLLPSILKTIQVRDNLNANQLYLECNDALFESIYKGTIVGKLNKRNGLSRFISDCRKIVLQQKI